MYRDLLVKEACEELSDEEKEALSLIAEAYSGSASFSSLLNSSHASLTSKSLYTSSKMHVV